jgi:hypothetical protein
MSGEPETRFGGGELKLVTMPSLELKCGDNANTVPPPLKNCGFVDTLKAIKSTRYRYGDDYLCITCMSKAVDGMRRQVTEVAIMASSFPTARRALPIISQPDVTISPLRQLKNTFCAWCL